MIWRWPRAGSAAAIDAFVGEDTGAMSRGEL
jgi:hypothetical protein